MRELSTREISLVSGANHDVSDGLFFGLTAGVVVGMIANVSIMSEFPIIVLFPGLYKPFGELTIFTTGILGAAIGVLVQDGLEDW